MIQTVSYTDKYLDSWERFVENSPGTTIAHQIGWKKVMEEGLGHDARYALAIEGSRVRGILPLVLVTTWWRSRYLISLPWIDYGGICADDPDAEKLLVDEAKRIASQDKAEFVELRSLKSHESDLGHRTDKVTFLLKLDRDPLMVWKGFDAKLRNQIRKSQKSELAVEVAGVEKLADFYRVFAWKMRDLGTPVWGYRFLELILNQFSDSARVVLVRKNGRVIAGGLLLAFKDRLYMPSASSYRDVLKYCPNHALYWEVIKLGCEQGYRYFDFGRSTVDSSTYVFKKQWVSTPTPLIWQYHLNRASEMPNINPDNPKYRLLIGTWRKLPLPLANFLGPRIIKNFP